jgi:superoxide reductase
MNKRKPYRGIVLKAINEFNKYRSPEAKAKVVSFNGDSFIIEFSGTFCYTCGFYDYFDDLRLILEVSELTTEIIDVKELEEGAVVKFRIFH